MPYCRELTLVHSRGLLSQHHLALAGRAKLDERRPTIRKASCMRLGAVFLHSPWCLIPRRYRRLIESPANVGVLQRT